MIKGIFLAAMMIAFAAPASAEAHFQQQATCYYDIDGNSTGADWGNQSTSGTAPSNSWEQQAQSGQYAYLYFVVRNDDVFTCPQRLNVGCANCNSVTPVW